MYTAYAKAMHGQISRVILEFLKPLFYWLSERGLKSLVDGLFTSVWAQPAAKDPVCIHRELLHPNISRTTLPRKSFCWSCFFVKRYFSPLTICRAGEVDWERSRCGFLHLRQFSTFPYKSHDLQWMRIRINIIPLLYFQLRRADSERK